MDNDIYCCWKCGKEVKIPGETDILIIHQCPSEEEGGCGRKGIFYKKGYEEYAEQYISSSNKEQGQQRQQRQQQIIKIHPAGDVIPELNLVIEPIGDYHYIYNLNGKKGIAMAAYDRETHKWLINVENFILYFRDEPLKTPSFRIPSTEKIQQYINGEYKTKSGKEIFDMILSYLKILYDVKPAFYYTLIAVGVMQSWLLPILKAVFYIGFTARYGGAKTTFLEGLSILSYHGCMAGNISSAAVARLTDRQKLSLFADEIDVKTKAKDNETYEVFRIGYRRGNPYIRIKDSKQGFREDICHVFGFKAFSYHSEVETALKSRSIIIPLRLSKDSTLPILNYYKENLGFPLFEDLFFWYMDNIVAVVAMQQNQQNQSNGNKNNRDENGLVAVVAMLPQDPAKIKKIRQKLTKQYLSHLSDEQIELLLKFFGRNEELLFIAMNVCNIIGINVLSDLQEAFETKVQEEELYSDNYLIQLLANFLREKYNEIEDQIITKGELYGYRYVKKTEVFEEFLSLLREKDIRRISPSTFNEYLKELGFDENINIKKERFPDGTITKALIFDDFALKELGLWEEEKSKLIKVEDFENIENIKNDIAGFETIKVEDAKWAYDILKAKKGMPKEFFERFFLEERGSSYRVDEVEKLYDIIVNRLKNEGFWGGEDGGR